MGESLQTTRDFNAIVKTEGTVCHTRLVVYDLGCAKCERLESYKCPKVRDAEDALIKSLLPVDNMTMLTYMGQQKPLITWCKELGFYPSVIKRRLNEYGNTVRYAFAHEPDTKPKQGDDNGI